MAITASALLLPQQGWSRIINFEQDDIGYGLNTDTKEATVTNLRDVLTERLRMKGLDSKRTYGVRLRDEVGEVRWGWNTPQWITAAQMGGFRVSGQLLEQVGLQLPPLWPLEAIVLEVEAL